MAKKKKAVSRGNTSPFKQNPLKVGASKAKKPSKKSHKKTKIVSGTASSSPGKSRVPKQRVPKKAALTKKILLSYNSGIISAMSDEELNDTLRQARELYNKQKEVFYKNPTVYSHILHNTEEFYETRGGVKDVSSLKRRQKINELHKLQDFFNAKGSTVPGARKIAIDADRRIYGVDKKGNPLFRMSYEQSVQFWSAYNEFKNLKKESYIRNMGSNTIQSALGEMAKGFFTSGPDKMYFDMEDFQTLQKLVESRKNSEEWENAMYEWERKVLAGKGPDL